MYRYTDLNEWNFQKENKFMSLKAFQSQNFPEIKFEFYSFPMTSYDQCLMMWSCTNYTVFVSFVEKKTVFIINLNAN